MKPPTTSHVSCHTPGDSGRKVSLTVLPGGGKVKKSRMGPRRAYVLLAVHVAVAVHVGLWYASGRGDGVRETLSPIEPSETMYTLNNGMLNAGVIFFALSLLSTVILGRWFCGWACHMVAMQDACGWAMKKLGVHPKPFRTRLLVLGPTVLALYMFAWPTFHRWVLTPVLGEWIPLWMGRSMRWPGMVNHVIVEDFWATFPPWYIAVPFMMVCGFVTVYFLGAKAFCTYGCPYGALFSPLDRLAPARIVVDENCHQCGHCTAVCTSNVRVHEEVRDFGAVVDPGCMKCMDCVSVCPNGALSFGFAKPAVLIKPKHDAKAADNAKLRAARYDLSLRQELVLLVAFVALMFSVRGMLHSVPLLMAAGLASIATWGLWKTWSILTLPNVRAQNVQLKLKGRVKPAGFVLAAATLVMVAASVWSAWVRWQVSASEIAQYKMASTPAGDFSRVISAGFSAGATEKELAEEIVRRVSLARPRSEGGLGWKVDAGTELRFAHAKAVLGDLQATQDAFERVLAAQSPQDLFTAAQWMGVMAARKYTPEQMVARIDELFATHPTAGAVRLAKATLLAQLGRIPESNAALNSSFYAAAATDVATQMEATRILLLAGQVAGARERLDAAVAARPRSADLRFARARASLVADDSGSAERDLREALRLEPRHSASLMMLAQLLEQKGKLPEAQILRDRAKAASGTVETQPPGQY
ncbi:MAG: 4Fe-4S binding protein [Planctomycetota bacterium]